MEFNKPFDEMPHPDDFTEADIKEQVFICLECLNDWSEEGFNLKSNIVICNSCGETVWRKS